MHETAVIAATHSAFLPHLESCMQSANCTLRKVWVDQNRGGLGIPSNTRAFPGLDIRDSGVSDSAVLLKGQIASEHRRNWKNKPEKQRQAVTNNRRRSQNRPTPWPHPPGRMK